MHKHKCMGVDRDMKIIITRTTIIDTECHYDNKHPKSSHVTIQKIKFVNSNINVSGIHTTEIPQQPSGLAVAETENETDGPDAANGSRSGDMIDFDKNLVNISISKYQSERTGES